MWGWIAAVAEKAVGVFFGSAGDVANTTVQDATVGIYSMVQALSNFLQQLLGDEMTAWRKAGPNIRAGGLGLGNLAWNDLYAWNRLLHTIIPRSLQYLNGQVHEWAGPKFTRIWRYLALLNRRVWFLIGWQHHWAGPWIKNWIRWRRWFYTWPNRTLVHVHNWLLNPHLFATWATPPLVPKILGYLSPPRHRPERLALARIVVDGSVGIPHAVEQAALQILKSPWR